MKTKVSIFILALTWFPLVGMVHAETQPAEPDGHFFIRGTVTRVDAPAKVMHVKNEGGLELTFHWDEAAQIQKGERTGALQDLAADAGVEIEYEYNADYEKMARLIKVVSPPASSERKPAPSA